MFSGGKMDGVSTVCRNEKQRVVREFDYNGDGFEDKFMAKACYDDKNQRLDQVSYYLEMSSPQGIEIKIYPNQTASGFRFYLPDDFSMAVNKVQFHHNDLVSAYYEEKVIDGLRIKEFLVDVSTEGELINSTARVYDKAIEGGKYFIYSPVKHLTLISPAMDLNIIITEIITKVENDPAIKKLIERRKDILSYAEPQDLRPKRKEEFQSINTTIGNKIKDLIAAKKMDERGSQFVLDGVINKMSVAGAPLGGLSETTVKPDSKNDGATKNSFGRWLP